MRNVSSSLSSVTSLFAAASAVSLSANWSLSSFSRLRNSSLSSLSRPTTVGVAGRLSVPSERMLSSAGMTGVMLLVDEGVGDVGAFFGATMGLSCVTQSAWSTEPPDRQIATSASSAAMYFWYVAFAAVAFARRPLSSRGESSVLTRALFLIDLARIPKRSVDSVSASLYDDGEQLMISVVRELPPRDSCRIRVSLESRYGTCLACRNK